MSALNRAAGADTGMELYTVVVIDDEQNILQSLKRCFRHEPFQIACAGSGVEGLKLIAETPHVAVIISDQKMPEMTGAELLARSRALAPDAIRVLLTGFSDNESTVAAMNEGGATHYIVKQKPWDDAELLQTVQECVRDYHQVMKDRQLHAIISRKNRELQELLSELAQQNSELERLSSTDALTGLTNRRRFLESLENERRRIERYGGSLSLIMFDIDNFKKVNDNWGHAVGDAVLCEIARDAQLFLRRADSAARYGGEEFVLLLPETGLSGAVLIANRLRQLVADTVISHDLGPPISVTVSIGVASLEPDESCDELLVRADKAMYQAKNNGRNRVELSNPRDLTL
ncbi:MAG: diguanylate cyclase [Desulfuromonadales bacterium]